MEYSNIFYIPLIKRVSGITTWILELSKKYNKIDITVMYSDPQSDREQINRLKQYVRVIKINPDRQNIIKCKKLFITYFAKNLLCFDAKEIIGVVHTNYKIANLNPYGKRVDKVIAVSKTVADAYEEISGVKPEVCYNPLTLDKHKTLLLISALRLTDNKGKGRMEIFAKQLENNNIPYRWFIYSNERLNYKSKNIIYIEPDTDVREMMTRCDYLVELGNDEESYSYTRNEALGNGVPIISTPLTIFEELGIKDKVHGYIIEPSMQNIPFEEIYNNIPTVEYKPPNDEWLDFMDKTSAEYVKEQMVQLRCIRQYKDVEYDRQIKKYEVYDTYDERAKELVEKGLAEYENVEPDPKCKYTISVIIPAWNQEELITRTLDSIPTRDNVEIIVVDDKSTDNTYKVLLDYKKEHKDKNIRLLHNMENKGVGYTYNRGLDEATGDYIVRIDSDDYFYTGQFNYMVDKELDGTDMVYYNLQDNTDRILEVTMHNRRSRCGAVKFIRREFIGETRCPDIRTAEDRAFNDELLDKLPTEKFTDRIVYHYNYPRENSLTDLTRRGLL